MLNRGESHVDLGFETIGNATLICHDRGPVLATDPWLRGSVYFGSWKLSHEIPDEQRANVLAAPYLWISHGHPDHLSRESLEELRDKEILLPDHYGGRAGGRIARDLRALGYRVRVLEDGRWTWLSDRLRVCSIGNYFQDAILLVDLDGRLIVDSNDCVDLGAGAYVRELARKHPESFLLALTGYGDADMIHFFDEAGRPIPPPASYKEPLGPGIAGHLHSYGIRTYVPFAAMHKYQRADSAWANEYTTPLGAHQEGFVSDRARILPAFVRADLERDEFVAIDPRPTKDELVSPTVFGDDPSQRLGPGDRAKIAAYLWPISHLRTFLGFLNFRVGGEDNRFEIEPGHRERGITFEVPRASLMTAIEQRIFDDLLIGNFMKTTLHGPWGQAGPEALYPDFTPFLKFADNGHARSPNELRAYFAEYRRRGYFGFGAWPLARSLRRSLSAYLEDPVPA